MTRGGAILWIGGVGWEGTSSTELRLISAIAEHRTVVWVAPPARGAWKGWTRMAPPALERRGRLVLVRAPATPGITRWPVRGLTAWLLRRTIARLLQIEDVSVLITASPVARLPRTDLASALFLTDDWRAGVQLMGFPAHVIRRALSHNLQVTGGVATVSAPLLDAVRGSLPGGRDVVCRVIPNGATAPRPLPPRGVRRAPVAAMIGQINERIDLSLLAATAAAGIVVRIVGPVTARDPAFLREVERLRAHPSVDWRGQVSASDVAAQLADVAVGLTPYAPSAFNRASSPLKTFDYLAAGIPVVSSDLPASRDLGSPLVSVTDSTSSFVDAVGAAVATRADPARESACHDLARAHSWEARARAFLAFVDEVETAHSADGIASPTGESEDLDVVTI